MTSGASAQVQSLGSYELVRKLGHGGMAEVFLAVQRMAGGVERLVVIKSILPLLAADERFVQMLLREARIAAILSHPNIVQIHDVAVIEGRPCIVMEFLRGRDLAFLLKRTSRAGERVDPLVAAAIVAQAASGLGYAHQKRDERDRRLDLVHRDVSPHNLFITRDGHVRVLDFGVAKSARQREQTETGAVKGKLAYMAPEYLKGRPIDGRADLFALGIVLWESLTCRRLFSRGDQFQTMQALFYEPVPRPSSVADVPQALEEITMRALEREPDARLASCEELAHELRAFLRSAGAPGEATLVAQWLEAAVPSDEDRDLYAAQTADTATQYAPPDPDEDDDWTTTSSTPVGSSGEFEAPRDRPRTITTAPPPTAAEPPTRSIVAPQEASASRTIERPARARRGSALPWIAGALAMIALVAISVVGVSWALAGGAPPLPRATLPPVTTAERAPLIAPSEPRSAPATPAPTSPPIAAPPSTPPSVPPVARPRGGPRVRGPRPAPTTRSHPQTLGPGMIDPNDY